MRKPRGWPQMNNDQKLEALKADMDQIYGAFDEIGRTVKRLADHVDRNFKRLSDDIAELKQALAPKSQQPRQ